MLVSYINNNKYEALSTVPYSYELNKWQLLILQEAMSLKKKKKAIYCISRVKMGSGEFPKCVHSTKPVGRHRSGGRGTE